MSHVTDWVRAVEGWIKGPCVSCEGSSPELRQHVAMPVTRPKYVDNYLEQIAGPNEQHEVSSHGHCINPKCRAPFEESMIDQNGRIVCPSCGFDQNVLGEDEQAWMPGQKELNPGGITRSGLTLAQMGHIGEQVVLRMGELPGIGTIVAMTDYHHPIDCIVESQRGKFGCEIKTNHAQAQERFKVGGKEERLHKITYCLQHGLKPALIGVRLNFYTDKAYIFFREGLSDTWIGNSKMIHVATLDFSDLNPFKSPDPQAQALAIDNAHLPDQSEQPDADIDSIFGPVKTAEFHEDDHPRGNDGKFTVKQDVHKLKIQNAKGKHTHDVVRCKNCGAANYLPVNHPKHPRCSSCGEYLDLDNDRHISKIVLANPSLADGVARDLGWNFAGRNSKGHRVYDLTDPNGVYHNVVIGSGSHGKHGAEIDAQRLRQRALKCMNGQCTHGPQDSPVPPIDEPGAPVLRAGQVIDGKIVLEVDGGFALVQDLKTGGEDIVPAESL